MNKSHRLGAEEWRQIIDGQRGSGLSVAAYCLQRGVTEGSFYNWKQRLRSPAKPKRLSTSALVEVTPPRSNRLVGRQICSLSRSPGPPIGQPGQLLLAAHQLPAEALGPDAA